MTKKDTNIKDYETAQVVLDGAHDALRHKAALAKGQASHIPLNTQDDDCMNQLIKLAEPLISKAKFPISISFEKCKTNSERIKIILNSVAKGKITIEEADGLMNIIMKACQVIEVAELKAKLQELQDKGKV